MSTIPAGSTAIACRRNKRNLHRTFEIRNEDAFRPSGNRNYASNAKNMNYQALFERSDSLDCGDNFCCRYYRCDGAASLECRDRYPMLFLLQGTLEMRFRFDVCTVGMGNLVVVDREELVEYRLSRDAVVLVYTPSQRLSKVFSQCCRVYEKPFSQVVPVLPQLAAWIETLLEQSACGIRRTGEEAHEQRRELARTLMSYPPKVLGELTTAFAACALGDCERCRREVCVDRMANKPR